MAAWSRLLLKTQNLLRTSGLLTQVAPNKAIQRCMSEHRTIPVLPSRWQWDKTKDWFHFYFMLGAIPAGLIIFCANTFIGPATLTPIPEGYIPKHWEYYRSPITRFFARYFFPIPQQEYEKFLHEVFEANETRNIRILYRKFQNYVAVAQDYDAHSYRRITHRRHMHKFHKEFEDLLNDE